MLDVHPPHHSTNTWRDFFLHIATIIVGLLIAIGLEQSVEAVHHGRERHELVADMRRECTSNHTIIDHDFQAYEGISEWRDAIVAELRQASPSSGKITISIPARPPLPVIQLPSHAVWTVAKSNGKAALLPDDSAETFDRVDAEANEFFSDRQVSEDTDRHLFAITKQIGTQLSPGETLHLSTKEADDLAASLSASSVADVYLLNWALNWEGACDAVAAGVSQREQIVSYIIAAKARHQYVPPAL